MPNNSTDATDLTIDLCGTATQPPSIDPASLRRAMRYGERVRAIYHKLPFEHIEAELRAGWLLKGETSEWDWVRAAVRVGYEQDMHDMDEV